MRKLIALMHVSLDGFCAGPKGEMDWISLNEAIFADVETLVERSGAAVYGRADEWGVRQVAGFIGQPVGERLQALGARFHVDRRHGASGSHVLVRDLLAHAAARAGDDRVPSGKVKSYHSGPALLSVRCAR